MSGQETLTDNSPVGLVDALAKRVSQVLSNSWRYPGESGEIKVPHVHAQYLPITEAGASRDDPSKDYPIVRVVHAFGRLNDTFTETGQTVVILFGGFDDGRENKGWRIPSAMLWAVLQDLINDPFIGAFEMASPVEWELPNPGTDMPPYFTALLTTTWRYGPPMYEIGREYGGLEGGVSFTQNPKQR